MSQQGRHQLGLFSSVLVLALSLGITAIATIYVRDSLIHRERSRFNGMTDATSTHINQQFSRYIDQLYAARGFVMASQMINRDAWQQYVGSLSLETAFPGIQGLGYSQRIAEADLQHHQNATRKIRGRYDVMPAGKRPDYFPIVLLEPENDRNMRAIGYDMFTEPKRNAAMQKACDSGEAAATEVVTLVQETGQDVQPGFLVYVPHYRPHSKIDTVEERRAHLLGFVYSPYRIHNLMRSILNHQVTPTKPVMRVYEGTQALPTKLIYESNPEKTPSEHSLTRDVPFSFAGQTWLLRFYTSELSEPGQLQWPLVILAVGVVISFLLFGITFVQYRGRKKLAESEAALRVSELRFRLKIEQSPVAIQLFDTQGSSVYVNPAWELLWGVPSEAAAGYNIMQDEQLQLSGQLVDVRRAFAGESVIIGPLQMSLSIHGIDPHTRRWVRAVLYPTRQTSGQVREVVMMFEDFTEKKKVEEDLLRAKEKAERAQQIAEEASRAKDQFLAVLSHELRNPLSPVLTMVNALQTKSMNRSEIEDALKVIQRNVELEARLIDDLLDITRISRGKMHLDMEIVDAHEVLRDALNVCSTDISAQGLNIRLELGASQKMVNADPARLQQVFWNLIKNAVKFTPANGVISISTRNEKDSRPVAGQMTQAQGLLIVEITDTGIGIEPDKLARIFDAFEQADHSITRRFGGLGLGLAISRALISAHGGELTATSPGKLKGATFTICLPVAAHDALPRKSLPDHDSRLEGANALRVLLVEDQEDARHGLTMILQKSGHIVRSAGSVAAALDAARDYAFDLLISDIGLPDGDGYEICEQLKISRRFFAVALTGLGMEEDIARARAAGFDEHLTKPVQFARLDALMARVEPQSKP